jgi:hypothetical protein
VLILFDHGTPKGLARALSGHTIHTAQSRGWDTLSNGALLNAAEEAGFGLLLTTDRRIKQNASCRARQTCGCRRRSTTSSACSSCSSRKESRLTEIGSIEPP